MPAPYFAANTPRHSGLHKRHGGFGLLEAIVVDWHCRDGSL